ncbi:uncharacterized protein BCR38DRAFT_415275 [Pseudomassariella vexata]|uniref:Zn(2)-C6 fungal-type domain-containing protein n=1 Tax=Pseudomassariella vexata TaxID=1141098 RepID=A0A1Y2D7J3_9PEZI|nr:uncharacterized protein BCR38DRAFT_415275 [Pseudomassariella vexata]ORY54585.1 hypothetical protein BCR38DRAFT_415275 [Pseudomassariella vexata]
MPSRRSHTNSHHGCLQCKRRRVKCDQTQPECARCSKKGQECNYQHLMSVYDPFHQYNAPARQPGAAPSPPRQLAPTSGVQRQSAISNASAPFLLPDSLSSTTGESAWKHPCFGMAPSISPTGLHEYDSSTQQLLHHYINHVSSSFISSAPHVELLISFQSVINRHSLSQPYVHHALLSFSALHLASLSTSSNASTSPSNSPHLITALAHKASALESFRPIIESVTTVTCEPALAASGLLIACAFGLPLAGVLSDPIDLLAQITSLFQGTVALYRLCLRDTNPLDNSTSPKLGQSVLAAMACEAPWEEAEAAIDKAIHVISQLDDEDELQMGRRDDLLDAARKLKRSLRRIAVARGVYTLSCMWFGMVSPAYVERVKQRDPLALVLLADWTSGLRKVKHVWWIQGCAQRTVEAIWFEIGGQYPELLAWAVEEAKSDL